MKRIDVNTVELTKWESLASDLFNAWLDDGKGIAEAVELTRRAFPELTSEFWEYLGS